MTFYPKKYSEAREQFRKSAKAAGLQLEAKSIAELGMDGEELTIDFAYRHVPNSKSLLVHISGVHGIEGFLGSAIQCKILENLAPQNTKSILFVHCLNPYGMSYLRRTNTENVDLNRNYREPGAVLTNADYRYFNRFLNPKNKFDFLWGGISAYSAYLLLGKLRAQQAVPQGQYDYPEGLFFGGYTIQKEILILQKFLQQNFSNYEQIDILDVHTGLGNNKDELLFLDTHKINGQARIEQIIARKVNILSAKNNTYIANGILSKVFFAAIPQARISHLTQEFGTYPAKKVLRCLRYENYYHHQQANKFLTKAKQNLREMFFPNDQVWRENAMTYGIKRFEQFWFQSGT